MTELVISVYYRNKFLDAFGMSWELEERLAITFTNLFRGRPSDDDGYIWLVVNDGTPPIVTSRKRFDRSARMIAIANELAGEIRRRREILESIAASFVQRPPPRRSIPLSYSMRAGFRYAR